MTDMDDKKAQNSAAAQNDAAMQDEDFTAPGEAQNNKAQYEDFAAQDETQKESQAEENSAGDDINPLQKELNAANAKINELTETAKRALADLQNFRKRTEEEMQSFAKFASANVFAEILPVFDSFERAIEHKPEDLKDNEWVKGIENIIKQFEQIMAKFRIVKMKSAGEKFDPEKHEAVAQGPGEKDIVVGDLESGYMIDEHVLRPAKVRVGDGSKAENHEKQAGEK